MMKFWDKAYKKISLGHRLILLIVVKNEGSSPGKPGFKMMVDDDGEIWGSIGGGSMEYKLVEQSRKLLKDNIQSIFLQKQDHHPNAEQDHSGMICSGVQWIAFYPLGKSNLSLISDILSIINKKKNSILKYDNLSINILRKTKSFNGKNMVIEEDNWDYQEQPGIKNTLYIFGAGHVSLALSKIAKDIDFDVILFDNRKNINTFDKNSFAEKKEIIHYSEAAKHVPEGANIYVAIMTFAHQSDTIVLKQMIGKKIKYLGMMGSELKVQSVFEQLLRDGYKKEELSSINSPIGLPINSITPQEIAVSIMAMIIKIKNSPDSSNIV